MAPIKFYSSAAAYYEFSNFAAYPLNLEGQLWPTSEHYFQAMKFIVDDPAYAEDIRNAPTPSATKKNGSVKRAPYA